MGLVLIALKSLCGAQPATIIRAIGQLEKRIGLVILPSHGTARSCAWGVAKWQAVKSVDWCSWAGVLRMGP
jgi:hypothetical protein